MFIKPSSVEEIECDTDVLIMLDRARPEQAFAQHVALAKHLVAKIEPEAIASGKTRVSIISFGNEATKDVGWNEKLPRRHILQKLDTIRQYNSATSFVQAAKTAIEVNLFFSNRISISLIRSAQISGIRERLKTGNSGGGVSVFIRLSNNRGREDMCGLGISP